MYLQPALPAGWQADEHIHAFTSSRICILTTDDLQVKCSRKLCNASRVCAVDRTRPNSDTEDPRQRVLDQDRAQNLILRQRNFQQELRWAVKGRRFQEYSGPFRHASSWALRLVAIAAQTKAGVYVLGCDDVAIARE